VLPDDGIAASRSSGVQAPIGALMLPDNAGSTSGAGGLAALMLAHKAGMV